jgi:putative ABC transport system permease protein
MSLSTHEALKETTQAYYERAHFGHVFAAVERAPTHLRPRIAAIPGVQNVQTRISKQAVLDLEGFAEPLLGRLVSIPEGRQPVLNQLVVRRGRLIEPGQPDEVILNESFAEAHGLWPGDSIVAVVNGKRRTLRIVGTAMSPEFIYVISPFALIPDKQRYGILWLGQNALEAAYDYDGAFNDLAVSLQRGADSRRVVDELDNLLEPYGGAGAIARSDHLSAWFVENELEQNRTIARLLPTVFLAVAAFLTSMVLNRLIATERSEIGLLKAFGYSDVQIGWHYAKLVIAIALLGILLGWMLGATLGRINTVSYATNLNLPILIYRPGPLSFAIGALVSLVVSLGAAARSVRRAATLPPSVAMNPPAPPSFRRESGVLAALARLADEPTLIILRQIGRWPMRAATTGLGFAFAIAMMILSLQFLDAIDELAQSHFDQSQREDLALGFDHPKPRTILAEVLRIPGVLSVEATRIVAADLSSGPIVHRGAIEGLPASPRLTRIFDHRSGVREVPERGIAIGSALARKLGVRVGDELWVDVREGRRPSGGIQVSAVFDTYIGTPAFMEIRELNRFLGERDLVDQVNVTFDAAREPELLASLKELPSVAAVGLRSAALSNFEATIAQMLLIFVGFFVAFSFALGFGVTYNSQRIALSERGRELATLRVLGFSRRETLYILIGETMLLVVLSLPVGCLMGFCLTALFVNAPGFNTELMRVPLAIDPSTYGTAISVLLCSGIVAGAAMKRRAERLDLIAALKTRE